MSQSLSDEDAAPNAKGRKPRSGHGIRSAGATAKIIHSHKKRCKKLPPISGRAEISSLVDAYIARGGTVTVLPVGAAAPINNGFGFDA